MAKLKGHAVIELTDVKTGKKERVEHDNIITSAAASLLRDIEIICGYAQANDACLPIKAKLLRGLYLFDNTLAENVNNISMPDVASAKLTGYAGDITSDGNDNKRGDYNADESGAISNGYKFVWDFGTNDANGEIAALALTNNVAGFLGYQYDFYKAAVSSRGGTGSDRDHYKGLGLSCINLNNSDFAWAAEYENDVVTCVRKTSATNIQIKKYKLSLETAFNLDDTIITPRLLSTENITISSDSVQGQTNEVLFLDGGDGYYYGVYSGGNGNTSGNLVITISKINKSTLEYTPATSYTLQNFAGAPQIAPIWGSYQSSRATAVIRNGYLYFYYGTPPSSSSASSSYYGIAKTPLNNPTEYTKFPNTQKTMYHNSNGDGGLFLLYNNNIYSTGYVIGSDDTLVDVNCESIKQGFETGSYGNFGKLITNGKTVLLYFGGYSNYIWFVPLLMQLESINNLDSPVTKTAAKTMKITYTLTYAE